ncbi:ATP-binding cassette subfamily G member 4-like [Euwallacea fornicatus]|uniref:ATP-binding cassette subfamily G member 4-like n=1 Tax=Euwallacea fornicatus TaxID=995702 RepID=UPI00339042E7
MLKQEIMHFRSSETLDIEFENVWLTIRDRKEYKKILKGVSGLFKSGELTAIMGPSGAGKTSLLNILTGYQKSGVEGVIRCKNGETTKIGPSQYKSQSRYILQDDYLISYFTVYEIMHSTTNLKIDGFSESKKNFLIDDILRTLGLLNLKQTLCGCLSGGQRKRLSIALEMIDDPPILFLDEPTTGLDSNSSNQCVQLLKNLAERGRTVICTIHQPSSSLYYVFSHVYVMAKGKCVFQGPPVNTVPYLSSHGLFCPKYHNPADFLMEICCEEHGDYIDKLAVAVQETSWRTFGQESTERGQNFREVGIVHDKDNALYYSNAVELERKSPSEWKKFFVLLEKQIKYYYRDWTGAKLKLIVHLLVGIFLGLTFQNSGSDASRAINNCCFINISIVYLCYTSLMPAALRFPKELQIIKKEYFNCWYNLGTFYLAYLVADFPLQVLFTMAYSVASYLISSQPLELYRFAMIFLIQSLVGLVASGMGVMYGTLVSPVNGTFLGAITTCVFLSMDGFICFFPHMTKFFYLASNLSFLSFSLEGSMQAIYGFDRPRLRCPEEEDYCLYTDPAELLSYLGMNKLSYWVDVGWIVVNFLLFRILAFYALRYKVRSL